MGTQMESVSKRVRTIYSVIASSNRLEILRILNTKGPLSYSELKTLAGFKSKKESGKFAYHLRKLVRQMLIALNRQERKYNVTSLGRLVLNLTRQIEEQSMVESGKLFVRTSRQTMEEFNSDKILQSLVREAGMPVELAQRITSETESRLYKFQTIYLTSPLIREIVNALLVEHGLEEYRHKLTRLGLPIYDISELINNTGEGEGDAETVLAKTANSVFSEYLMLSQLPRDVADSHFGGDIHISNAGEWGLMPDTVFFDLVALKNNKINMKGKLLKIPRIDTPKKIDDAINTIVLMTSILSRETANEIVLENLTTFISEYSLEKTKEEIRDSIRRAFTLIPSIVGREYNKPNITFLIDSFSNSKYDETLLKRVLESTLMAYQDYIKSVPTPVINLVFNVGSDIDPKILNLVSSIIFSGGKIAISTKPEIARSYTGLKRDTDKRFPADCVAVLNALSINLPRLAYESNRDEVYFRAKLAILLQTALTALQTRRKIISNISKKNLLPALTSGNISISEDYVPLTINLTGLYEAINRLTGERAPISERLSLTDKISETASKSATEIGEKIGEKTLISMVGGDSGPRFAAIDIEKFGRSSIPVLANKNEYSQAPTISVTDVAKQDYLESLNKSLRSLSGGFSIDIEIPKAYSLESLSEIIGNCRKHIDFFRISYKMTVCRACGAKFSEGTLKCDICHSTSMKPYSTT